MLILLPPSESKAVRASGRPMSMASLSFPELTPTREQVAQALMAESGQPFATARLKVSPSLHEDVARNTALLTSPAIEVRDLYTGVLYQALDLPSLPTAARSRATRWTVIISALYGALRLTDRVATYRLSMNTPLAEVAPLARRWRTPLEQVLPAAAGQGLIVDARSTPYAAAWTPRGRLAHRWVSIRVPGASHDAKYTRGLVVRAVCEMGLENESPASLAQTLAQRFTVDVQQTADGRSWYLDVAPVPPPGRR